jgi:DNA polymerase-3 subunit epsilon/CBS domain-containing protein
LLNVDIFFDAVPVHGDAGLAGDLLGEARAMAAAAADFLKLLAVQAAGLRAPLGLLGGLKRDGGGRTDLKMGGLLPIVAGARVLALRHGVEALSTPGRLRGVAAKGIGAARDIDAVLAAHGTILGAVLAQQLEDAEAGVALSPRIDPGRPWAREVPAALHQVATMAALVTEGRM